MYFTTWGGLFDLIHSDYDLKKRLNYFSNFRDAIRKKKPVCNFVNGSEWVPTS